MKQCKGPVLLITTLMLLSTMSIMSNMLEVKAATGTFNIIACPVSQAVDNTLNQFAYYSIDNTGVLMGDSNGIGVRNQTVAGSADQSYSSNQVIVKYKTSSRIPTPQKYPDVILEKGLLLERVVVLNVTEGKVNDVIAAMENDPDIEYVEPNYIMTASFVPNDPYYHLQWHFPKIQMERAWDISTGTGVTIAVLDTGVAYEDYLSFRRAPDLVGTTFVPGYDFVNNDAHPNDDEGHGTHVCGTIAQTTNNGIGVAGIAFNAKIMPVKVLNATGRGPTDRIVNGIVWAANNGAVIINLSLGGPNPSQAVEDAVNDAYNQGVTVIASSGNDDGPVGYPAAYSHVIAVGAIRYDETRAYYSNYGPELDFVAPGGDVTVDQNGDGYGDGVLQQTFASGNPTNFGYYFSDGTSMAAPHVSGVAALLYAAGYTSPDQIEQRLVSSAKDLGPSGWDQEYGYGLIQAASALPPAPTPTPTPNFNIAASPPTRTVTNGSSTTFTLTVSSLNGFNSPVSLALSSWPTGLSGTFSTNPVTPAAGGSAQSILTVNIAPTVAWGQYSNLPIVGTSGNISKSASISLEVVITTRTSFIVTFETVPDDRGRIIFADHTYRDGDAISKAAGSYVIGGTPGADHQFARWETSGSISVADVNSPSTMCTVSGSGTLRMIQSSLSPTPSPSPIPIPRLGCLIVTALYGSPLQPEVQFLRHFRDETLVKVAGQTFRDNLNDWYYSFSPQVSEFIRQNQWTRPPIILLISPAVSFLHLADAIILLIAR